MNSQPMANNLKHVNQKTSVNTLLETLKNKVQDFAVIDRQGQLIGKVKNIILNANHRLNLVISQQEDTRSLDRHRLFLLWSQKVNKIDNEAQSVFIDLDKSEIEFMPEYLGTGTPGEQKISDNSTELNTNSQTIQSQVESANSEVDEENIIRLIEERLIADSSKHKLGEVIVRKEIETRMVQVPVRREKLIIEQVSPENRQLAEIDLGQGEISGLELITGERPEEVIFDGSLTVNGVFSSPKIASLLLNAIALEKDHGCKQVKITIAVANESLQKKYQEWFDRCSLGQKTQPEK
ncbi:MAG: YsnF/AvaK domain-containing protein [Trichormus sp. ATA11-4-KO1]|nr:YsnF/AvaK domain-containing protein [Trichormus sp. ATA11-4-KO1]